MWPFTGKKLSVNFWLQTFCVSMGVLNPFIAGRKQFYELKFTSPSDKNNEEAGYASSYGSGTNS